MLYILPANLDTGNRMVDTRGEGDGEVMKRLKGVKCMVTEGH